VRVLLQDGSQQGYRGIAVQASTRSARHSAWVRGRRWHAAERRSARRSKGHAANARSLAEQTPLQQRGRRRRVVDPGLVGDGAISGCPVLAEFVALRARLLSECICIYTT
jgi:hypothetical protein